MTINFLDLVPLSGTEIEEWAERLNVSKDCIWSALQGDLADMKRICIAMLKDFEANDEEEPKGFHRDFCLNSLFWFNQDSEGHGELPTEYFLLLHRVLYRNIPSNVQALKEQKRIFMSAFAALYFHSTGKQPSQILLAKAYTFLMGQGVPENIRRDVIGFLDEELVQAYKSNCAVAQVNINGSFYSFKQLTNKEEYPANVDTVSSYFEGETVSYEEVIDAVNKMNKNENYFR